ncbi:hypothetical protein Pa4123_51600 [Phytohabitans aurantiacus]|uniref:DUF222 domain-containing protein n=2 Tax=Phytohabitans aurantiacus TaxID=3016789 RepID=A0ABQ5R1Q0_9ACTN|nr:hypothetical protein Pa4123_51600 [Phytohabitans aurantiacus]
MMDDAVLGAIAAAVASRTVEGVTDAGRAAFSSLMQLVRRKVDAAPSGQAVLDAALADPADRARVDALRAQLAKSVAGSPVFAGELARLWQLAQPANQATDGGVVNHAGGTVNGPVVQARDISGGVAFGAGDSGHLRGAGS